MEKNSTYLDKIYRFTVGERIAHWTHGVCFLLLLFTGLGMLSMFFRPAMDIFGGILIARNIHRVVAVIFVVVVGANFFIGEGGRNLRGWIKSVLSFNRDDLAHTMNFPIEFFGGHRPFPPQGKFNGGEKMNSAITITGTIFLTLSGFMMWFSSAIPNWLLEWAYPVHSGFALLMGAFLLAHMYLSLLHPDSNQAFKGMINGYVPGKFAFEHYEKWYNEVKDDPRNK